MSRASHAVSGGAVGLVAGAAKVSRRAQANALALAVITTGAVAVATAVERAADGGAIFATIAGVALAQAVLAGTALIAAVLAHLNGAIHVGEPLHTLAVALLAGAIAAAHLVILDRAGLGCRSHSRVIRTATDHLRGGGRRGTLAGSGTSVVCRGRVSRKHRGAGTGQHEERPRSRHRTLEEEIRENDCIGFEL